MKKKKELYRKKYEMVNRFEDIQEENNRNRKREKKQTNLEMMKY